MKKKLVIFEINECDFSYFLYGAKKFNFPEIIKFINNKKITKTFTRDKIEGLNLDPWVQWVSVHTGVNSEKHKILRTGQSLKKNISQVWEKIGLKNSSIGLWGLFNSKYRNNKNINFYYPDPWNYTESAFPRHLNSYLMLPRYYAMNYPNISILKILFYGARFFRKIFFSKTIFYLLKNFLSFCRIFKKAKLKSFNLYFFLDLLSLSIIKEKLLNKELSFLIIALNSFAHYQHNYWDNKKNEFFYFWYLNEMIKKILLIDNMYESSICLNGFSQKKIKPKYHLRPLKPQIFLNKFNINYKSIKPNMTSGAQVFFHSQKDKIKCIKLLKKINYNQKYFFSIQDYKNTNKIFYKFNIFSYKNNLSLKNLSNKNFDQFKKVKSYTKLNSKKSTIKTILDNVKFMKSTSEHTQHGIIYLKSFKINKKRIQNTELFKYVIKYFN